MTRRRYTQEEEQIIAQEVSSHQTNIKQGLLIASERLGRSFGSVQKHWYAIQSKREPAFCVFSRTEAPVSLFRRILRWLGL